MAVVFTFLPYAGRWNSRWNQISGLFYCMFPREVCFPLAYRKWNYILKPNVCTESLVNCTVKCKLFRIEIRRENISLFFMYYRKKTFESFFAWTLRQNATGPKSLQAFSHSVSCINNYFIRQGFYDLGHAQSPSWVSNQWNSCCLS